MWHARLLFHRNDRPHPGTSHLNGLAPVWSRRWTDKVFFLTNRFPHVMHTNRLTKAPAAATIVGADSVTAGYPGKGVT